LEVFAPDENDTSNRDNLYVPGNSIYHDPIRPVAGGELARLSRGQPARHIERNKRASPMERDFKYCVENADPRRGLVVAHRVR
jgi:hypothetical protein